MLAHSSRAQCRTAAKPRTKKERHTKTHGTLLWAKTRNRRCCCCCCSSKPTSSPELGRCSHFGLALRVVARDPHESQFLFWYTLMSGSASTTVVGQQYRSPGRCFPPHERVYFDSNLKLFVLVLCRSRYDVMSCDLVRVVLLCLAG